MPESGTKPNVAELSNNQHRALLSQVCEPFDQQGNQRALSAWTMMHLLSAFVSAECLVMQCKQWIYCKQVLAIVAKWYAGARQH